MSFSIQFLGGVGTVTGSKFLVQYQRANILIDCGLFQGLKELRLLNREKLPIDETSINAVLLTHAHLDHVGYLPLLVKNGFKGKVYCTKPTADLAKVILMDSAKIQEEDADFANQQGFSKHDPARPLYDQKEAQAAIKLLRPIDAHQWFSLAEKVRFRYSPSSHILGSAFIELEIDSKRMIFSGDLGRAKPLMFPPPERFTKADYLVIESTYGDRIHPKEAPIRQLARIINETVQKKGHIIIPSFAVGRAQDILYLLSKLRRSKQIPEIPIFLDSPMAIKATEIFLEHADWHKLDTSEVKQLCAHMTMVRDFRQSDELSRMKKSSIVIAGSGMLTGGRVLHHLHKRLSDPRNTIVLAGYQAAGTRGRLLRDGINELKMFGQYVPVKAKIEEISSMSAHADQFEILDWLRSFKKFPKNVFIVHGEPQAADALRVRINDLAKNSLVKIPCRLERIELK